jgi:hypothetical protein
MPYPVWLQRVNRGVGDGRGRTHGGRLADDRVHITRVDRNLVAAAAADIGGDNADLVLGTLDIVNIMSVALDEPCVLAVQPP